MNCDILILILVGTSCLNDVMRNDGSEVKFESSKFETLRTLDQSSDGIGIERQHSNDHVTIFCNILVIIILLIFTICICRI